MESARGEGTLERAEEGPVLMCERLTCERGDRGSGTLLAIAVLAVVGAVALFAGALGGAAVAHGRAQGAADLSALTAAYTARDLRALGGEDGGPRQSGDSACGRANQVALANNSALESCFVDGHGAVTVEVSVGTAWGNARATARAGSSG